MQQGYSFSTPIEVNDVIPMEFKVIIEPDEVEATTEGGLHLPDVTRDRISYAVETGKIISMAGNAFGDESLFAEKPKIGDRVFFSKYSGSLFEIRKDREVKKYRLMNDKDVCAILR
jgi:co-chaperonin GroES (HSP10)